MSRSVLFTDIPIFVRSQVISQSHVVLCVFLQVDYYYEYTQCDSTGTRWRVAIPQSPGTCTGLPEPVRGTECSELAFLLLR